MAHQELDPQRQDPPPFAIDALRLLLELAATDPEAWRVVTTDEGLAAAWPAGVTSANVDSTSAEQYRAGMDLADRARVHAALADPHRLAVVDALGLGDLTPRELAAGVGIAGNLLAHHLRRLEEVGLIGRRASDADGRRRYVTLRRDAMRHLTGAPAFPAGPVLFVCTHNSARSPFAAALWQRATGAPALSAGSAPAERVNPQAVRVGLGFGVDLSAVHPQDLRTVAVTPAVVVTVCDRAREGGIPFVAPRIHWSLPDPAADGRPEAFQEVFEEITRRVRTLAAHRSQPAKEPTR